MRIIYCTVISIRNMVTKPSIQFNQKFRFYTKPSIFLLFKMPPKKASKRKIEAAPIVKDPFSASKRTKGNEKKEENLIEADEVKKSLKFEEQAPEICLDSSKENIDEKKVESPKTVTEKPKKSSKEKEETKSADQAQSSLKYDKEEFKNPGNEKDWNLKIASWNVNGIRAWLGKDGIDYIKAEDPDICCLQETKCDKSKIPNEIELKEYHCYWLSGETQGYAGVGLMSKIKPINVQFELDKKEHSDEGRIIIAEYEKFFLINSYIPNSGRGLVRLDYRIKWEKEFRAKLSDLEKIKPIIWCGDLNVAHNEIDLKNPKTNHKTAGFTKEERACFTSLLSDGYFDSFRYLYPKQTDAFTFWTYMRNARASNVGWRLDYFVLSEKLKENLVDNMIRSKVMGSDHCPIVLFLKM